MANSIATGVLDKTLKVKIYMYNGRDNVGAKIYKTQPALDENGNTISSLSITPYGEINSQGFQFITDKLYRCNYCQYDFGGLTYYAYVKVDTYTNGAYLYTTTVDPLTTAYYAGCMNSKQYCVRSPRGRNTGPILGNIENQLELDPLCHQLAKPEIIRTSFANSYQDMYVVMVTSQPNEYSGVAGVGTYVMSPESYTIFIDKFSRYGTISADDPLSVIVTPQVQEKAISSILKVYMIPKTDVKLSILRPTDVIYLSFVDDLVAGLSVATRSITIDMEGEVVYAAPGAVVGGGGGVTHTVLSDLGTLTPAQYVGKGSIIIPDLGMLQFSPQMLDIPVITSVGYTTYVDYDGGTRIAYLVVNGIEYKEVSISAHYPIVIPFSSYVYNYQNLIQQLSSFSGSMTGYAQESLSPKTNSQAPKNAKAAGDTIGKGNIALAVVSEAAALANSIIANEASYNVTGTTGGSTIMTSDMKTLFKFIYFPQWDVTNIQLFYGKITNQIINLNSADDKNAGYGYFQTSGCSLPTNGLPREIIAAANSILDSGAYLGQTNMPD